MIVEDTDLEESLNAAAQVAKEASNAESWELADIASRLLNAISQAGKKVNKISAIIEGNPEPSPGLRASDQFEVDAHMGFASACSKIQVQFRNDSTFSKALHGLFASAGVEHTSKVVDTGTKQIIEIICRTVVNNIEFEVSNIAHLMNDYFTTAGGNVQGLSKAHKKIEEVVELWGGRESPSLVAWAIKLRPLHIFKLLSKSGQLFESHTGGGTENDSWVSMVSRLKNASQALANDGIATQLFAFDGLQDDLPSLVDMWCKFLSRSEELSARSFQERSDDEWTVEEIAMKKRLERTNKDKIIKELQDNLGTDSPDNMNVMVKALLVNILLEIKMKQAKQAEVELKAKWAAVADGLLNDGQIFSDPADEDSKNLRTYDFGKKDTDEHRIFVAVVSPEVSRTDAVSWCIKCVIRQVEDTLWNSFIGNDEDSNFIDVGREHIVKKEGDKHKKFCPYYLHAEKAGLFINDKAVYSTAGSALLGVSGSVRLCFMGDIQLSIDSSGDSIKGSNKINIAKVEVAKNLTFYIWVTPSGSFSQISSSGLHTTKSIAWDIKAAPLSGIPTMSFDHIEVGVEVKADELLEHSDVGGLSIKLKMPCLVLNDRIQELVQTELVEEETDKSEKEPPNKKRQKELKSGPQSVNKILRVFPLLQRPCTQSEKHKIVLAKSKKAEKDALAAIAAESQSSDTQDPRSPGLRDDENQSDASIVAHLLR